MGRLELEIDIIEVKKIFLTYPKPGRLVLQKINSIRKILEPEGYSIGIPSERYIDVPRRIIITHSEKSHQDIIDAFYEADRKIG